MRLRLLFAALTLLSHNVTADAGVRKSLVIALDGTRADGVISSTTPAIDSLIDGRFASGYRGAYAFDAQTIQDAPTSSAYNHASIMLGVTGTKHGVNANDAAALAAIDYVTYPHYLTTLEQTDPSLNTAYLVTWAADLAIVTGADYVVGASDADNVARVVGILDGTFADLAGHSGTAWPLGTDPDAIFLFLDDGDGAGHSSGFWPSNPGYRAELESIDAQIGAILTALTARPTFDTEQWQVVITSDHGGLGTGHGGLNPNSETIPFVVTSQNAVAGAMSGHVGNLDAAPTAIAHMLSAIAIPPHYDGVARGAAVIAPAPPDLSLDLVVYLPFDADLQDVSGAGNHASIGPDSDVDPTLQPTDGLCGGFVAIRDFGGGTASASYLTLGTPASLDFAPGDDYTLSLWFRTSQDQTGDSVLLGNKDWVSGYNPGTLLLANEADGDDFGLNLADGTERRDIEPIDFAFDQWWFVAASIDRDQTATLFIGGPDGTRYTISDDAAALGDVVSTLPWNIGQDGTGSYPSNLHGDIDELRVWRRALALDELELVFANGAGLCSLRLLRGDVAALDPVAPPLASVLPLDPATDVYLDPVAPGVAIAEPIVPLVFFALDDDALTRTPTLRMTRLPASLLRVVF